MGPPDPRIQKPVRVLLLNVLTLGLYKFFWLLKLHRQVNSETKQSRPALLWALCGCTPLLGTFSLFKLGGEISELQRQAGMANRMSPGVQFKAICCCPPSVPFVYQGAMNSYWEYARAAEFTRR